jgi:hypothetical protein
MPLSRTAAYLDDDNPLIAIVWDPSDRFVARRRLDGTWREAPEVTPAIWPK